ncbi:ATP-dependent protease [Psychromonas sp. psych-6C06]|nr:ATP-dependent protease [Psychromonas sp. psych-6C06]
MTTEITCLTATQCTTDFSALLNKSSTSTNKLHTLFPIATEVINNFIQLSPPLLFLNAPYWQAATAVINETLNEKASILTLQNYDQEKLFGRINVTKQEDISLQKGAIADLNGGLLILHISPLLVNPHLWFLLKAFLISHNIPMSAAINGEKIRGELPANQDETISTKIILIANRYQLDELNQIDPDYSQINSQFVEISGEIKCTDENIHALHQYCQHLIKQLSLTSLDNTAFSLLFTYLTRLCEHQKNIRFSPQVITSLLQYAQLIYQQDACKGQEIEAKHFQQALSLQQKAQSNAQNFSDQALVEKQLKIQLQGKSVGQINGLSVVELMGYPTEFGEVFRISASDMVGDGEIIDVERKVELAGNVHAKSTLIVQGYLNHFFTHINNFPLSCNVVFEQSYQESDGDSASLAILLAVTSCYSTTPIFQNLFVTGALDQQGNVLAIGGINQKIESITRLFKLGLLEDSVTILMPQANQINLVLSQETLDLIQDKKINIFPIQHCLQAFPFAMDKSFESIIEDINKRIHFLHKEEEDEPISFFTKCVNLLR